MAKYRRFHPFQSIYPSLFLLLFSLFLNFSDLKAQSDTTFKKILINDKEMYPLSIEPVPSGGFIVGGKERGINETDWTGFILKLSEQGEPEWKRAIISDTSGNFQQVKVTKDGGFIGVNNYLRDRMSNNAFNGSALTWCKTTATGTVQWAKTIRDGLPQNLPAIDLEIGDDGTFYTIGAFGWGANSRTVINKIDAQGNQLINPTNFYIDNDAEISDLTITPSKELVVTGSANSNTVSKLFKGVIVYMTDEGGKLTTKEAKTYVSDNIDINLKKAFNTADGGLIVTGIAVPDKHLVMKLDKTGNVEWGKMYTTLLSGYKPNEAIKTRDNGIIMSGYNNGTTLLFKIDILGNIQWARNINAQPMSIRLLSETQTGNIIAIGNGFSFQNTNHTGLDFYISLFDKNGLPTNCTYSDAQVAVEKRTITAQSINSDYFTYPTSSISNNIIESPIGSLKSKQLCKCLTVNYIDTILCKGNTLKIVDKIYDNSARDTFILKNPYGCDSIVFLNITSSLPTSKTIDTTICKGDIYTFGIQKLTESGQYTAILRTKAGCDSTVTLNLIVRDTVIKNIEAKICEGDSYSFFNKKLTKSGIYIEKTKISSGCDSTVVLNLTVNTKSIIQEDKEQTIDMVWGDTIRLTACTKGEHYEWTPSTHVSCAACDTPSVTARENVVIKAKIIYETGCSSTCTYNIVVKNTIGKLFVPNAFSPNNDGSNDVFQVRSPKIKLQSLEIFNRWGDSIFKQIGENAAWDGTINGKTMPNEVYVYLIRYTNLQTQTDEIAYGDVTLLR